MAKPLNSWAFYSTPEGGRRWLASAISANCHIPWPDARKLADKLTSAPEVEFVTETRMTHVDGHNAAPDWLRILWRGRRLDSEGWQLLKVEILP
jgi:hypothetical protein